MPGDKGRSSEKKRDRDRDKKRGERQTLSHGDHGESSRSGQSGLEAQDHNIGADPEAASYDGDAGHSIQFESLGGHYDTNRHTTTADWQTLSYNGQQGDAIPVYPTEVFIEDEQAAAASPFPNNSAGTWDSVDAHHDATAAGPSAELMGQGDDQSVFTMSSNTAASTSAAGYTMDSSTYDENQTPQASSGVGFVGNGPFNYGGASVSPTGSDAKSIPLSNAYNLFCYFAPNCDLTFEAQQVYAWFEHHLEDHKEQIRSLVWCPSCGEGYDAKAYRCTKKENFRNMLDHYFQCNEGCQSSMG